MVGDSYADDVVGARALGMRAILLDRDERTREQDRIADLFALPSALGLTLPLVDTISARHAAVWCPSGTSSSGSGCPKATAASARVATGPTQTSSPSNSASHAASVRAPNAAASSPASASWSSPYCSSASSGRARRSHSPGEELRLQGSQREVAAVRGRVHPIAREPARQQPVAWIATQPMGDECVAPVGHRDTQPRALARAGPPDERREHLGHGAEPPAARSAMGSGGHDGTSSSAPAQPR